MLRGDPVTPIFAASEDALNLEVEGELADLEAEGDPEACPILGDAVTFMREVLPLPYSELPTAPNRETGDPPDGNALMREALVRNGDVPGLRP